MRRQGLEPRTRGLREEPGWRVAGLVSRSARPPLSVEVGPGGVAGLYGWLYFGLANASWAVYGLLHADATMWVVGAIATPIAALVVVRLSWIRGLTAKRIESA